MKKRAVTIKELTREEKIQRKYDRLIESLERDAKFATERLATWQEKLQHPDPLYAFEWASEAIYDAATVRVTGRVVQMLRFRENETVTTAAATERTLAEIQDRVLCGARYITSRSTSPVSNACN